MPSLALAVEDSLSEAVGHRLVNELGPNFKVELVFQHGGFGYLKSNINKFCELARRTTVLLITDLDNESCAPNLIKKWLNNRARPDKLLFRVAVREIESWLLADHIGMKHLLGANAKIPNNPDELVDPKRTLLSLAKTAPREIRSDLLPAKGAISSQGLGYNQRLGTFVETTWNPARAAGRSSSLRKVRERLSELAL